MAGRFASIAQPADVLSKRMSDDPVSARQAAADTKLPEESEAPPSRRFLGRRVKFVWGAARVIQGRWHLGLFGWYPRVEGNPAEDGLAISVRGFLLWGLTCTIALYCSGAAAIYAVRRHNPHNLVRYSDILLWPVQRARIAVLTGRSLIADGLSDLAEKRYGEGITKLRIGLMRYPQETQARVVLAQLYIRANQRPLALKTLTDRLDVGYPGREFLEALFNCAASGDDYAVILDACERYRTARNSASAEADRPWLLQRQVQTLLAAGRPGEALRLAETAGADAPAAIKEGEVFALIDLGRTSEASALLAVWRASPGANVAQVLRLQVRVLREARQFAEMEAAIKELCALTPADPKPPVYGIVQRAMAHQDASAAAALEDYLFRFGATKENVLLVVTPLAEVAAGPLVERCIEQAVTLGWDLKPFRTQLLRAQEQRGDWLAAQRTLDQLRPQMRPDNPAEMLWLKWQGQLVGAAIDPSQIAQGALLEIFRTRPLPLSAFAQTGELLLRAGRFETAREVANLGQHYYPASPTLAKLLANAEREQSAKPQ